MPEAESKSNNWIHVVLDLSNDALELVKKLAIIIFILLFLFYGGFLRKRLDDLGFTITEVPIKLEDVKKSNEKAKAAASDVDVLKQKLGDLQSILAALESHNIGAATEFSPLKTEIASLQAQANSADANLKASLIDQQNLIRKVTPQSVESDGWLYVGQVDESKTKWAGIGEKNISLQTPLFPEGELISLTGNVYLHGAPARGGWHTQGDVTSAVPSGSSVQIIDTDYSHANAGGWFVWLKVRLR